MKIIPILQHQYSNIGDYLKYNRLVLLTRQRILVHDDIPVAVVIVPVSGVQLDSGIVVVVRVMGVRRVLRGCRHIRARSARGLIASGIEVSGAVLGGNVTVVTPFRTGSRARK